VFAPRHRSRQDEVVRTSIRILLAASAVAACALVPACTTGETSEDQRDSAVRRMVQRMGVTEDVAVCIVDEVEATLGLEVLEAQNPPDAVAVQLNEITTDCLLVVPGDGSAPSTTRAEGEGTTSLPTDPNAVTTTTGAPRP
jgi:hypothetical protein